MRWILILVGAVIAVSTPRIHAQATPSSTTPDEPSFEVVSVKPNNSLGRGARGGPQAGGRFTLTNTTAFRLIANAYRLHDEQVIGGPGWINADRFDIAAEGPPNVTNAERSVMLQKLLADRFLLKVHHEMRVLTAANLIVVRKDGRLGPHLKPATDGDADCTPPKSPPDFSKGLPPCSQTSGVGRLSARGITMQRLADTLGFTFRVSGFVYDRTNLTGPFNIDALEFRPGDLPERPPADWPPNAPWPSSDTPSIYTALEEQLGLKLEFIKEPVDVIVIDHIEKPAPD